MGCGPAQNPPPKSSSTNEVASAESDKSALVEPDAVESSSEADEWGDEMPDSPFPPGQGGKAFDAWWAKFQEGKSCDFPPAGVAHIAPYPEITEDLRKGAWNSCDSPSADGVLGEKVMFGDGEVAITSTKTSASWNYEQAANVLVFSGTQGCRLMVVQHSDEDCLDGRWTSGESARLESQDALYAQVGSACELCKDQRYQRELAQTH